MVLAERKRGRCGASDGNGRLSSFSIFITNSLEAVAAWWTRRSWRGLHDAFRGVEFRYGDVDVDVDVEVEVEVDVMWRWRWR